MFIIAEEKKSNTLQVKKIYFLSNTPQCGRPHNKFSQETYAAVEPRQLTRSGNER